MANDWNPFFIFRIIAITLVYHILCSSASKRNTFNRYWFYTRNLSWRLLKNCSSSYSILSSFLSRNKLCRKNVGVCFFIQNISTLTVASGYHLLSWAEQTEKYFIFNIFVVVVVYMLPSVHSLSATQRIDRETTEKKCTHHATSILLNPNFEKCAFFYVELSFLSCKPCYYEHSVLLFFNFGLFGSFVFLSLPFYRYDCY